MSLISVITLVFCSAAMLYIMLSVYENQEEITRGDVLMFLWCTLKILEIIFKC